MVLPQMSSRILIPLHLVHDAPLPVSLYPATPKNQSRRVSVEDLKQNLEARTFIAEVFGSDEEEDEEMVSIDKSDIETSQQSLSTVTLPGSLLKVTDLSLIHI